MAQMCRESGMSEEEVRGREDDERGMEGKKEEESSQWLSVVVGVSILTDESWVETDE